MSTSITNLTNVLRNGHVRIMPNGRELFGTVIRAGKMNKTVTVRVSRYSFNYKAKVWLGIGRNFHAHDEENFCQTGDKVVIRTNPVPFSKIKTYYVRNIILATAR